jgi:hypothetical protein
MVYLPQSNIYVIICNQDLKLQHRIQLINVIQGTKIPIFDDCKEGNKGSKHRTPKQQNKANLLYIAHIFFSIVILIQTYYLKTKSYIIREYFSVTCTAVWQPFLPFT